MTDDQMTCLYCGTPVRVSFMGQVERCPNRCGPLERFREWAEDVIERHRHDGETNHAPHETHTRISEEKPEHV